MYSLQQQKDQIIVLPILRNIESLTFLRVGELKNPNMNTVIPIIYRYSLQQQKDQIIVLPILRNVRLSMFLRAGEPKNPVS